LLFKQFQAHIHLLWALIGLHIGIRRRHSIDPIRNSRIVVVVQRMVIMIIVMMVVMIVVIVVIMMIMMD
jgi:hypothetical protein